MHMHTYVPCMVMSSTYRSNFYKTLQSSAIKELIFFAVYCLE